MKNVLVQIEACSLQCPVCGEPIYSANGSDMHTPDELQLRRNVKCPACDSKLGIPTFLKKQPAREASWDFQSF